MNENKPKKDSQRSAVKQRPNSSRFPPLVPQITGQSFRRSASFEYSFSSNEIKTDEQINENVLDMKSNESQTNLVNDFSNEINGSDGMVGVVSLAAAHSDQCSVEYNKLRKENQILKQNFLRMSKIIQKHSKLMTRKDEIILRLQENKSMNASNSSPKLSKPQSIETKFTIGSSFSDSELKNHKFMDLSKALVKTKEIQTKSTEISEAFQVFCQSIASDFCQHLSQFIEMTEEIQIFIENNNHFINGENSDEIERRVQELNERFTQLNSNYEIIERQNIKFKSIIEYLCRICDYNPNPDMSTNESIDGLKEYLSKVFQLNQTISTESEDMKNQLKEGEDYVFELIECLSETELELQLLGRNTETFSKVIDKMSQKFNYFKLKTVNSFPYFQSLNKILIQLYKNQLKWVEILAKTTTSSVDNTGAEDTSEEDNGVSPKVMTYFQSINNESPETIGLNDMSDNHYMSFDDITDELGFDDFDIESINYILLSKQFDYNLKSNLEVVNEEDEDIDDMSEDQTQECQALEEINECFDQKLYVSKPYVNKERDVDIKAIVEQVLIEMVDKIEDNFSNKEYSCNVFEENVKQISIEMTSDNRLKIDTKSESSAKDKNINSDFVSEDNSSSNNEEMAIIKRQLLGTYDELKQHNERQTSELFLAKTRINELENQLSFDNCSEIQSKYHKQKDQYMRDELRAWKELVVQQKAIVEKISRELEVQQKINSEKDKTIDNLKCSSNNSNNSLIENQNLNEYSVSNGHKDCENDINSEEEFDLNELFCRETDENDSEYISDDNIKQQNISQNSITSIEDIEESNDKEIKKSLAKSMKIDVWSDDNRNSLSDESSYSVRADKLSPISMPEELLSMNKGKVFIAYNQDNTSAVRRHSCQGRVIYYGNHPRKRKLELKKVEIVFPQQKESVVKSVKKVSKH